MADIFGTNFAETLRGTAGNDNIEGAIAAFHEFDNVQIIYFFVKLTAAGFF